MTKQLREFKAIERRNFWLQKIPLLERFLEIRQIINASRRWRECGLCVPVPYFIRRAQLLGLGNTIQAKNFIETGTYRGDTTYAMARHFESLYSIEIQPTLAKIARKRFSNQPHIKILEGDSGIILKSLMMTLRGPSLIYLDGHDSGGITGKGSNACPVEDELISLFEVCKDDLMVVIDDARLFGTDPDYPTIDRITALVADMKPLAQITIELDTIVIKCLT